ncbi:MAG: hypothetical protein J6T26_01205 [Firmicutes bacterium]|nr:hypothetical protein [Bacillota bacterium]
MTIEEYFIDYLAPILGSSPAVAVSGSVPHPMPAEFVTVEKTGSSEVNRIPSATLAVQSWSTSRAAAAALNDRVKAAMAGSVTQPHISHCSLVSDYNYTDLSTKKPRYQAVFDVVYLF